MLLNGDKISGLVHADALDLAGLYALRSLAVPARRQPYNATILRVVGVRTATKLEKLSPAGYFGRPGIARVVTFVQHGNFIFLRLEIA